MERLTLSKKTAGGAYFSRQCDDISFCPTGSKLLDLSLGGGWAERRIANIIGDRSTGKTLLAMEAAANFNIKYHDDCRLYYRESEAAFLKSYATTLGLPVDKIDFGHPIETVEELFEDLSACTKRSRRQPSLYILDSLDALSDVAELDRGFSDGSYGTTKARQLSKLFRMLVRDMNKSSLTVLIISQVRDKIGAMFGRKTTRSGGRALDFYCSQVVSLAQVGTRVRTIDGQKRTTAVCILAKIDKNKVGLPFREARFDIAFGFGIDDMNSCLSYLKEVKALDKVGFKSNTTDDKLRQFARKLARPSQNVLKAVEDKWHEIENKFLPKQTKYGPNVASQ